MLAAFALILALIPAHVLSWYYYGLNGVNADVPAAEMARYADFAEDDGHAAEHAMAFKRAGGRYAVAYTDPAYVPYCHPPFAPPAGHCEGPIGDLVSAEDAWFHGPDGARVHRFIDKEFDHAEALNPASPSARRAWRQKTVNLLGRAPALDFIFSDDSGGPFLGADGTPRTGWFAGYNAPGVELTTPAAFRDAWSAYLGESRLPLIVNGYDDTTGLPSFGGAYVALPFVHGEARENCFRGDEGIKTDRRDKWRYHADGLLAVTALHRWAICLMQGKATPENRVFTLASWWMTYDPQWSVAGPLSPLERETLLPELDIVPTDPLRSATTRVAALRTPSGAYVREFRACYQERTPLGPCAAVVNPTARSLPLPALAQRYGHTLTLDGRDMRSGGRARWSGGEPAVLAPESAEILRR